MLNIDINKLNSLEIDLYNYILKNSEKVIYMTIREIAEEVHVSTTTIIRFCRKFNVSGFSEFKTKLKSYINNKKVSTRKTEDALEEFYERTLTSNLKKQIKEASEIVSRYDTVIFIGVGSSGPIASYGAKYMAQFGKFTSCIDDPFYPIINKSLSNAIAILISVSGENNMLMRMLDKLKEIGVKAISITNQKSSSLAKLSDYNISYYITRNTLYDKETSDLEYRDITSQVPVLYILESLAREL